MFMNRSAPAMSVTNRAFLPVTDDHTYMYVYLLGRALCTCSQLAQHSNGREHSLCLELPLYACSQVSDTR